jgi:hypothetical protein
MSTADGAGAPALIVAQAHPATSFLQALVAADGTLACTAGSGLLPFCDRAVVAWREVEGGTGAPSPLAAKSVRSVVSQMRAVVLARSGCREWCEISTAPAQAAEAFLGLYPDARIACVYCHVSALTGLRRRDTRPSVPAANSLIRIKEDDLSRSAYWAGSAASMLALEEKFPGNCRRFRHEDIVRDPRLALAGLRSFFGLPGTSADDLPLPEAEPDDRDATAGLATGKLPVPVRREVARLLSVLDYVSS